MRTIVSVKCPICDFKTALKFKRPKFMDIEQQNFNCDTCQCQIIAQIQQYPEDQSKVQVKAIPLLLSEMGRQIVAENKEMRDVDDSTARTKEITASPAESASSSEAAPTAETAIVKCPENAADRIAVNAGFSDRFDEG